MTRCPTPGGLRLHHRLAILGGLRLHHRLALQIRPWMVESLCARRTPKTSTDQRSMREAWSHGQAGRRTSSNTWGFVNHVGPSCWTPQKSSKDDQ